MTFYKYNNGGEHSVHYFTRGLQTPVCCSYIAHKQEASSEAEFQTLYEAVAVHKAELCCAMLQETVRSSSPDEMTKEQTFSSCQARTHTRQTNCRNILLLCNAMYRTKDSLRPSCSSVRLLQNTFDCSLEAKHFYRAVHYLVFIMRLPSTL